MKIVRLEEKKEIRKAAGLLYNSKEAIVLTGAGISTESGIPDSVEIPAPVKTIASLELYNNPAAFRISFFSSNLTIFIS